MVDVTKETLGLAYIHWYQIYCMRFCCTLLKNIRDVAQQKPQNKPSWSTTRRGPAWGVIYEPLGATAVIRRCSVMHSAAVRIFHKNPGTAVSVLSVMWIYQIINTTWKYPYSIAYGITTIIQINTAEHLSTGCCCDFTGGTLRVYLDGYACSSEWHCASMCPTLSASAHLTAVALGHVHLGYIYLAFLVADFFI